MTTNTFQLISWVERNLVNIVKIESKNHPAHGRTKLHGNSSMFAQRVRGKRSDVLSTENNDF